jgi:hypothetical protein
MGAGEELKFPPMDVPQNTLFRKSIRAWDSSRAEVEPLESQHHRYADD